MTTTISVLEYAKFTLSIKDLSTDLLGSTTEKKIHASINATWCIKWFSKRREHAFPDVSVLLCVSDPKVSYKVVCCKFDGMEGKIDDLPFSPERRRIFVIKSGLIAEKVSKRLPLTFECKIHFTGGPMAIELPPQKVSSQKSKKAAKKSQTSINSVKSTVAPVSQSISVDTQMAPKGREDRRIRIGDWFLPTSNHIHSIPAFEDSVTLKVLRWDISNDKVLTTPKRPIKGLIDEYWWMECAIKGKKKTLELNFYVRTSAINMELDVFYSCPQNKVYERLQSGFLQHGQQQEICNITLSRGKLNLINGILEMKCEVNFHFLRSENNHMAYDNSKVLNNDADALETPKLEPINPSPNVSIEFLRDDIIFPKVDQKILSSPRTLDNIDGCHWWLSCYPAVHDSDANDNEVMTNVFLHVTTAPLSVNMYYKIEYLFSGANTFIVNSKKKPILILQIPSKYFLQNFEHQKVQMTFDAVANSLAPSNTNKNVLVPLTLSSGNLSLSKVTSNMEEKPSKDSLSLEIGKYDLTSRRLITTKKRIIPGTENVQWWILCGVSVDQTMKNLNNKTVVHYYWNLTFTICVSHEPVSIRALYYVNVTTPGGKTHMCAYDITLDRKWKIYMKEPDFNINSIISIECTAVFTVSRAIDTKTYEKCQELKVKLTVDFVKNVKGKADVFSMDSKKLLVDSNDEGLKWWLHCYTMISGLSEVPNAVCISVCVNQVPVDVEATFIIQGAANRIWRKCTYKSLNDCSSNIILTYDELECYFQDGVCEVCCFATITPRPILRRSEPENGTIPKLSQPHDSSNGSDSDSSKDETIESLTDEQHLMHNIQMQNEEVEELT